MSENLMGNFTPRLYTFITNCTLYTQGQGSPTLYCTLGKLERQWDQEVDFVEKLYVRPEITWFPVKNHKFLSQL